MRVFPRSTPRVACLHYVYDFLGHLPERSGVITVLFSAFVFYDIFFVFISRMFFAPHSADPAPVTETTVVRTARSAQNQGFMEAVALGTAGRSGESIPATFRWRLRHTVGQYGCSYRDDSMLLGFGDAVIPGLRGSITQRLT
ncbi:unnamed protein product [Echinostoma caproni]|uniref:DUF2156 domain-containing protein n=1 Tax=Echinostoma caproni TaxID=27848 RepID=A0A183APV1_9TREM|nr:unnamed protein product [Echinostoma caproni]